LHARKVGQPSDFKPHVTAGVDAGEWLGIERHVQGNAVVTRPPANADAHARKLAVIYVDARRAAAALRDHTELRHVVDDAAFQRRDEIANAKTRTTQVDERIHHELAGPVIRDLPAAIDLHNGNVTRREHVRGARIHAQRVHRRMLEEPDLVGRVLGALVGEALHGMPGGHIVHAAESLDDRRGARHSGRAGCYALRSHRCDCHGNRPALQRLAASELLSRPALLRFSTCSAR
jgi:hypothetical protein